jgi:hypothetical protein
MPVVAKHPTTGVINVILGEGEKITEQFNSEKVLIYRRDSSTGWQLTLVKPLGALAAPEDLRQAEKPKCNYDFVAAEGDPIHQHEDGTWWHFDELWQLESGPYEDWDTAYGALTEYCIGLETAQKTAQEMAEEIGKNVGTEDIVEKLLKRIFPNAKQTHGDAIIEDGTGPGGNLGTDDHRDSD